MPTMLENDQGHRIHFDPFTTNLRDHPGYRIVTVEEEEAVPTIVEFTPAPPPVRAELIMEHTYEEPASDLLVFTPAEHNEQIQETPFLIVEEVAYSEASDPTGVDTSMFIKVTEPESDYVNYEEAIVGGHVEAVSEWGSQNTDEFAAIYDPAPGVYSETTVFEPPAIVIEEPENTSDGGFSIFGWTPPDVTAPFDDAYEAVSGFVDDNSEYVDLAIDMVVSGPIGGGLQNMGTMGDLYGEPILNPLVDHVGAGIGDWFKENMHWVLIGGVILIVALKVL